MLVFDDLHLDDDPHLTPYTVEGVKDGKPAIQRVCWATVSQSVETDVDLTNGIVSGVHVRVVVHQPGEEARGEGGWVTGSGKKKKRGKSEG